MAAVAEVRGSSCEGVQGGGSVLAHAMFSWHGSYPRWLIAAGLPVADSLASCWVYTKSTLEWPLVHRRRAQEPISTKLESKPRVAARHGFKSLHGGAA